MKNLAFEVCGLTVREAGQQDEPADFLAVFNEHADFIDANTLRTGVQALSEYDVAMFLWHNEVMENSHCLSVRAGNVVEGILTLLVPHPHENQPWIGLFLLRGKAQHAAGHLLARLEDILAADGWLAVYISPMISQLETLFWWQSQGYKEVDKRLDNDKRAVQVLRKDLTH